MEIVIFTKLLSDYSLYFIFASFFGALFGLSSVMLLPALIFTVSALLCWVLRAKKLYIRLLPLPLMALCLLFAKCTADYAVLIPPAVYTVFISARLLFFSERGAAITQLRFGLILGVILAVIAGAFVKIDVSFRGTLTFMLVFALSSIMLIRMLRYDQAALCEKRLKLLNLSLLLAVCVLGLLFSSPLVLRGVGGFFSLLMAWVISPVLVKLIDLLGYAVQGIGSLLGNVDVKEQALDNFGKDMSAESLELVNDDSRWAGAKYIVFAIVAIIVIALLIAAFFIFRRMILGKYREAEKSAAETGAAGQKTRSRRRSAHTPREQVREYYRRFLQLCRRCGVKFTKSDTSLEIGELAAQVFPDKADELRGLYIRARYDDKADIPAADVKAAKELYGSIKSGKTN